MRKPGRILAVAFVAVVAIALVSSGTAMAQKAGNAKEGEAAFKSKCVICHGPEGAGNTPMGKNLKIKDLRSDEVQKLSDAECSPRLSPKERNRWRPMRKTWGKPRSATSSPISAR